MFIEKIFIRNAASYGEEGSKLETDKPINLIYGLNGTGKTTISRFLNNSTMYPDCSLVTNGEKGKILVFNQDFIERNFHSNEIPGVFTLAEENIEAQKIIDDLNSKISKNNDKLNEIKELRVKHAQEKDKYVIRLQEKLWEITSQYPKTTPIGKLCIEGFYGSKDALLKKALGIKLTNSLNINLEELANKASQVQDSNAIELNKLTLPDLNQLFIVESNTLFQEIILGNENSNIKDLIEKLNNSSWVYTGINYLNLSDNLCPFCQQDITKSIVGNIADHFNSTYKDKINQLNNLLSLYDSLIISFKNNVNLISNNKMILKEEDHFKNIANSFLNILKSNRSQIEKKIQFPDTKVILQDSKVAFKEIEIFIDKINHEIEEYNKTIRNKNNIKEEIKQQFWQCIRMKYNDDIDFYNTNCAILLTKEEAFNEEEVMLKTLNKEHEHVINANQSKTINIDSAIKSINNNLQWLGLSGFHIIKYDNSQNKYRLARDYKNSCFKTLSEGEKTIITFLYFIELSKGKLSITDPSCSQIIVIDDPISSLSHNYVFHTAQLIKNHFFLASIANNSNIKQVFVLTHNLYFFNEMLNIIKNKCKNRYKNFRVIKTSNSQIVDMAIDEILNDYQAYWLTIKDIKAGRCYPALLANSMRNILDHFFGFIFKEGIEYISELDNKYEAFKRYMNKESHTGIGNISDTKDIDVNLFFEAFKQVFIDAKHEEHYTTMIDE